MRRIATQIIPASLLFCACFIAGCNRLKQKTKDTIYKSGETVGKGSSEFINGVSEGIDQTFECKVEISPGLHAKGVSSGKFRIANEGEGTKNLVTIYLIYDKDFQGDISAKIFDRNGKEYGRTKVVGKGKGGEARYQDFAFDKRTNIESKSTFLVE